MDQLNFINNFVTFYGFKGLTDFETKICVGDFDQDKLRERLLTGVNSQMESIKKLFKVSKFNLSRKKYHIDSVPLAFSLLKNILNHEKIPFETPRNSQTTFLRLCPLNINLVKYYKKMDSGNHSMVDINHTHEFECKHCHLPFQEEVGDDVVEKDGKGEKVGEEKVEISDLTEYLKDLPVKELVTATSEMDVLTAMVKLQDENTIYTYNKSMTHQADKILGRSGNQAELLVPLNRGADLVGNFEIILLDSNGLRVDIDYELNLIHGNQCVKDFMKINNDPDLTFVQKCYPQVASHHQLFLGVKLPNLILDLFDYRVHVKYQNGFLHTIHRRNVLGGSNYKLFFPETTIFKTTPESSSYLSLSPLKSTRLEPSHQVNSKRGVMTFVMRPAEFSNNLTIPIHYGNINTISAKIRRLEGLNLDGSNSTINQISAINAYFDSYIIGRTTETVLKLDYDFPNQLCMFQEFKIIIQYDRKVVYDDEIVEISFEYDMEIEYDEEFMKSKDPVDIGPYRYHKNILIRPGITGVQSQKKLNMRLKCG